MRGEGEACNVTDTAQTAQRRLQPEVAREHSGGGMRRNCLCAHGDAPRRRLTSRTPPTRVMSGSLSANVRFELRDPKDIARKLPRFA